jgi:hypothetical protein
MNITNQFTLSGEARELLSWLLSNHKHSLINQPGAEQELSLTTELLELFPQKKGK